MTAVDRGAEGSAHHGSVSQEGIPLVEPEPPVGIEPTTYSLRVRLPAVPRYSP